MAGQSASGSGDGLRDKIDGLVVAAAQGLALAARRWRALSRGWRDARKMPGFGLIAAIAWRVLAALLGIGLATALVSSLSVADAPRLGSLPDDMVSTAPVRDVRRIAYFDGQGDGWARPARTAGLFRFEARVPLPAATIETQRRNEGGSRRDILSGGGFGGAGPAFRMVLSSGADEAATAANFVIALAREASGQGLSVQRSVRPSVVETKLGPVENAEITLDDGAARRDCLAFRGFNEAAALALQGWWCGPQGRPVERQTLACLIDSVELAEGAAAPGSLKHAFGRDGSRSSSCVTRAGPKQSGPTALTSWLDGKEPAPPLRKTAR